MAAHEKDVKPSVHQYDIGELRRALRSDIAEIVDQVLDKRNRVDAIKHARDHQWITEYQKTLADLEVNIKKKQERRENIFDAVLKTVLGAIAVAVILGILKGLYDFGSFLYDLFANRKK